MADDNFEANPPHLDGVPDMSQLIYLEAPNILHNLEVQLCALFLTTTDRLFELFKINVLNVSAGALWKVRDIHFN